MLVSFLIMLILSSAVINEKEKSIIYCRMSIQGLLLTSFILYNNLFIKSLEKGIGIYGGMFNVNTLTHSFNLFIIIVVSIILILTSFNRISVYSITLRFSPFCRKIDKVSSATYIESEKDVFSSESSDAVKIKQDNITKNNINSTYNELSDILVNAITTSAKKIGQLEIIEYALVTIFILCGAIFLMSTVDLISMFLSIELQSYGLYILSTLYRDSESATNSGLTYFLLGGMSSCFILLGSGLLYVNSGTTNIENICILNSIGNTDVNSFYTQQTENIANTYNLISETYIPSYISISLVIIIVGFFFKISAAPFHFWSPDVYDGIPTIVTTFVAIVPKVSIFIFILQLVLNTYFVNENNSFFMDPLYLTTPGKWRDIITISSLMSLIIGSLLGLTQYRIKRLFAYSTISHVGFILLALSVTTIESIQGYIFYILQYTISNINAFFILVAMGFLISSNYVKSIQDNSMLFKVSDSNNSPIQLISQLKGYFYVNSYICISLTITLFSFVGIPPLIGFFAKQMVLSAALDEGYVFITLVAVVTSVVAAVYYLNIIKNMFFFNTRLLASFNSTKKQEGVYNFYPVIHPSNALINNKGQINITNSIKSKLYTKEQINLCARTNCTTISKINSALSITIAILTMIILTFIFVPNEWLRVASVLSITLFKL